MPAWMTWDFAVRFLTITLIDLALSGDNAIVIGMAAASLPPAKRKMAILFGGVLAIALRVGLTSVATLLMLVPLLSAAGGLVLIWVVYRLLKTGPDKDQEKSRAREARSFRQAIFLILTADFMMSLDNIIAVAGSAHGNLVLLIAGLALSMPLLMVTGGVIARLIDKARWLIYVGAAAISFTAARMVFEDRIIEERLHTVPIVVILVSVAAAIVVPGVFVLASRRKAAAESPHGRAAR